MASHLLQEFLSQDCDAAIKQKLLDEIAEHGAARVDVVREYTFNRFNVHLDFQKQEAVIDDELDVSADGSCRLSLDEFAAALGKHHPAM